VAGIDGNQCSVDPKMARRTINQTCLFLPVSVAVVETLRAHAHAVSYQQLIVLNVHTAAVAVASVSDSVRLRTDERRAVDVRGAVAPAVSTHLVAVARTTDQ